VKVYSGCLGGNNVLKNSAGTIFFYLCLPETKGKSLQEIEDYFSGRTSTLNLSNKKSPTDVEGLNNTKPKLLTVEKDKLLP
jgi:facilitated trehalose transporter